MHAPRWCLALLLTVYAASPAAAQRPSSRLNGIFPCGAAAGGTASCVISGADLEEASGLDFSHPGIGATRTGSNTFEVRVGADVPPGLYDVRVVTARGLSNFRAFSVGDWPEVVDADDPDDAPRPPLRVTTPVIVNGRIGKPTGLDRFTFAAKKGARILIDCRAWRLDSPLDGTLEVTDARGKTVAYSGDYAGRDPFVDFTAAEDGDYSVKVWDFVYAGGPDYVYRLRVGSLPYLDAVVPAALKPGSAAKVTLVGRNLPGGEAAAGGLETLTREVETPSPEACAATLRGGDAVRPAQAGLDGFAYRLNTPGGGSNAVLIGFTDDPVVVEREPNDTRPAPQDVPFPCEVTGAFNPAGDVDVYRFEVARGEKVVVEVYGERQSGLIDPVLAGFDPSGRRVFSGDDDAVRNVGKLRFTTQSRDGRWEFTAPAAGAYCVQVRDLYSQQRGEPRFAYRLSVRRPRPDFRLVAVPTHETQPDSTTVGRGGRAWLDVLALRTDGFDGPIRVEASELPPGLHADPVVIGPGTTSVPLVFTADADAPDGHARVRITGTAEANGRPLARTARGGGLTWPTVNTPGIARMADGVPVAVRPGAPYVLTARSPAAEVRAGETVTLAVTVDRAADWSGAVQVSAFDLPPGVTSSPVNVAAGSTTAGVTLALPKKLRPGPYTFTVQGTGQVPRDYAVTSPSSKSRGANVRDVVISNAITLNVRAE